MMRTEKEIIGQCLEMAAEWRDMYPIEKAIDMMHGLRMTLLIAGVDTTKIDTLYQEFRRERNEIVSQFS